MLNVKSTTASHFLKSGSPEAILFWSMLTQFSGSMDTSLFNTGDNALIIFYGYYLKYRDYATAFEKLNTLAAIAGDDSLTGDLEPQYLIESASFWGHKMTVDYFEHGSLGVNFLARVYSPDVWYGDLNSSTDIMRSLAKLHTTVNLNQFTPLQKLQQKLSALYMTDENTLIFSKLLETYKRLGGTLDCERDYRIQSYWSQFSKGDQYPNHYGDWMLAQLPEQFNVNDAFTHLDNCTQLRQMLRTPSMMEIEPIPHKQDTLLLTNGQES
jgi:hypothetical protein